MGNLKNQEITVKTLKQQIKQFENEQSNKINMQLMKRENDLRQTFDKELNEKNEKYNKAKLQLKQLQNEIIHLQQSMDEQQNNLLQHTLSTEQNKDIDDSTQNMLEEELDRCKIKILTLTKERDELLLSNKHKQNMERMRLKLNKLPNEKEYKLLRDKVVVLQQQFLNDSSISINASIDTICRQKLQSLQSELTTLRMDFHSQSSQLLQCQNEGNELKQQNEEQKTLIIKLENDLTKYIAQNDKKKQSISINMNEESEEDEDEYAIMKIPQKNNEDENEKEDNSAFLIVCEQRDRFRKKSQELEGTKMRMQSKMDRLLNDNSTLKDENVSLYSKIKFLENYQQQNVIKKRRNNERMETEMKYEGLYEESMNPFVQFKEKEKEKRIKNLSLTGWIAFEVASTVLSKRVFRLFGVFYALLLHLLVFYNVFHEYSHIHCKDEHEQLPPVQIDLRP